MQLYERVAALVYEQYATYNPSKSFSSTLLSSATLTGLWILDLLVIILLPLGGTVSIKSLRARAPRSATS
jgi:hypothetical protein